MNKPKLTRRGFVASTAALAVASTVRAAGSSLLVETAAGKVAGDVLPGSGVRRWLGIPYAQPASGPLRWRPPQAVMPWKGTLRADRFSASPWATPEAGKSAFSVRGPRSMGEDCLSVNVWSPAEPSEKPYPVMVWIYGGAFVAGSSDNPLYEGEALAREGVVFVSINYRVGILGFFAHPELAAESPDRISGNYGLMDQIAALRWVQQNIAGFGGDPGNVTILGQSAGAFSVGFHLVMPQSRGLFHRAIAQSGAPMGKPSSFILLGEREPMERAGLDFAKEVGASGIADMRAMKAPALVEANASSWRFYPQIDGHHVPDHPFAMVMAGRHAAVPVIVGRNRDEGTLFPPLGGGTVKGLQAEISAEYAEHAAQALRFFDAADDTAATRQGHEAMGDIIFNWNAAALAIALATSGRSAVYSYQFEYVGTVPASATFNEGSGADLGAFHGSEIGFALRTQSVRGFGLSREQSGLMDRMSGWWAQFARTGDPNAVPGAHGNWPRYLPGKKTVWYIGAQGGRRGPVPQRDRLAVLGRAMNNTILERA
ncbi:para-nitrobenzyl esterase [Novosphingobium sp. CF614]|uniref:carboxylesterase/lipase family protein n=1 Tax=Novosphingobium sp. CF614 TaxID=1884364 RepID=UPI0008EC630D|nr:carboxylesterase family protein [Novosphingobium sp. CF614]SFF79035.1 para-nitrobenzyl esterase [Novosphingobium sp. CF614]